MSGEIITIGRATLYHGDCREILPTLPKVDLVLTDPPYGIGSLMKGGTNTGHWCTLYGGNEWDMELPDIAPIIAHGLHAVVWGGNYFPLPPARCVLAWRKLNAVPTQACFELAWTSFDKPAKMFAHVSGGAMRRDGHPTQKPIPLMEWCLNLAPKTTSTVADPFMGSGTTGVACANLGKTFYGIEREPKYFDIACERIENAYRQERLIA